LPHLWPTGSSSGWPPSITARYFSSCPSDSISRWTPCPPGNRFSGRRRVTAVFGYGAPHSSARGTSTLLNNALLSAHCEPLRHPSRPGPSLTSCQLIVCAITAGTSRVVDGPPCLHAVANAPAGLMKTYSLIRFHQLRPSPKPGRVGSCITRFEACSAFTRVTACLLAKSPKRLSAPEASAVSLPRPLL
jgi:hypothetical protein